MPFDRELPVWLLNKLAPSAFPRSNAHEIYQLQVWLWLSFLARVGMTQGGKTEQFDVKRTMMDISGMADHFVNMQLKLKD